jgi:hypothetical protein
MPQLLPIKLLAAVLFLYAEVPKLGVYKLAPLTVDQERLLLG